MAWAGVSPPKDRRRATPATANQNHAPFHAFTPGPSPCEESVHREKGERARAANARGKRPTYSGFQRGSRMKNSLTMPRGKPAESSSNDRELRVESERYCACGRS